MTFRTTSFSWMLTLSLLVTLLAAGCNADTDDADMGATETDTAASADMSADTSMSVTIEQGERSPEIAGATANFAAPASGEVLDAGSDVMVTVNVESFETQVQTDTPRSDSIANSSKGQHVHIIVDGGPYHANYEPGQPFNIGMLENGAHSAIVFPSRSYHESVKNEGAMDFVNFYVGEEVGDFPLSPDEPTIIYSRPKGSYTGAGANRIMLDFYLHNVELSADGYSARYQIREKGSEEVIASTTLTEWVPSFIEGLEKGTYIVRLELLDAEGNVVPGPLNTTDREIMVDPEATGDEG